MSAHPISPSFVDYSQALERLQRRTAIRRAVMAAAVVPPPEIIAGEEQERRDRELLEAWESQSQPFPLRC